MSTPSLILNAMTVDVEEHFQVSAFETTVSRAEWSSLESRVVPNTRRLCDLLEENDVRATFFVLGWIAEHAPELVREIADRGHEVGCHGYSHRLIYEQTPEEFRSELTRSKRLIEDAAQTPVRGYRAASFSIRRGNLWALDELVAAGFEYDSSLFPIVHDRYGIPGGPRGICRVKTPGGSTLLEVPPSTVRLGGMVLPAGGGGYLRIFPAWFTHWAISRLNLREKMPAVVYVHPWELDPDQPKIRASWKSRLRHYTGLRTTEPKLRALCSRFAFGPMSDVLSLERNVPERLVS